MRSKVDKLTVTQEWPLTYEDTKGKSLVISLGGDGTYLKTSSMIDNVDTPLLGINTDPGRSLGVLCGKFLYKERSTEKHIERIFEQLEEQKFSWNYRQRINCQINQIQQKKIKNKLVMNEFFMAEKTASKTSIYKVIVDDMDMGRFKSSGIIISTGTGSSGWLYGAKRVTTVNVQDIIAELKEQSSIEQCNNIDRLESATQETHFHEEVANKLSRDTNFSTESKNMYYYVRESFSGQHNSEGFAKSVKMISELEEG